MKGARSCHCGAIAYNAEVDPDRVGICHCMDCQELTGSAYRVSVATTRADLVMLRGAAVTYVESQSRRSVRAW